MNILITSVGRRNYIVDYFKQAIGNSGKVFVSNSIENTSGMYAGDVSIVTPPIISEAYIPFLLDLCEKNDIKVIIPLFDMDLSALSLNKKLFESNHILPLVSDYSFIHNCFDKLSYPSFMKRFELKTPLVFNNLSHVIELLEHDKISFPLILKPRWGTGSISTKVVHSTEILQREYALLTLELETTYINTPVPEGDKNSIIIQEMIEGEEYGIDVINNLTGQYQTTWVKKKFGMRAGETDGAKTVRNELLENCGAKLGKSSGHIGIVDVDIIISKQGIPYIIDINPRFGGGYPFSHIAGADLPLAIVKWLRNKDLNNELEIEYDVSAIKGISLIRKK